MRHHAKLLGFAQIFNGATWCCWIDLRCDHQCTAAHALPAACCSAVRHSGTSMAAATVLRHSLECCAMTWYADRPAARCMTGCADAQCRGCRPAWSRPFRSPSASASTCSDPCVALLISLMHARLTCAAPVPFGSSSQTVSAPRFRAFHRSVLPLRSRGVVSDGARAAQVTPRTALRSRQEAPLWTPRVLYLPGTRVGIWGARHTER